MVKIMEESRPSDRNLYIVLSVCLLMSIMSSVLMLNLISGTDRAAYIAQAACRQAGFGSLSIGAVVVGTLAANLAVWTGVLMIGLMSWAGRSLGLSAPRQKLNVVAPHADVKLSAS